MNWSYKRSSRSVLLGVQGQKGLSAKTLVYRVHALLLRYVYSSLVHRVLLFFYERWALVLLKFQTLRLPCDMQVKPYKLVPYAVLCVGAQSYGSGITPCTLGRPSDLVNSSY